MKQHPNKHLQFLDDELRALEPEQGFSSEDPVEPEEEDVFGPGDNPAVDFGRMCYDDEEPVEDHAELKQKVRRRKAKKQTASVRKEKKKKKHPFGWQFLIGIGEIGLILWILRWWLNWIQ